MTNFFESFFVIVMIFCLCALFSFFIRLIIIRFKEKNKKSEPKQTAPTIYFVQQTQSAKKRKKTKRKNTTVALKGLMITPEKFEALKKNNFED